MAEQNKPLNIVVLEGDGIGKEVVAQAVKILKAVAKRKNWDLCLKYALIGGAAIDAEGIPLPPETTEQCRSAHAVLLGAVGGEKWNRLPMHIRPQNGLLMLRAKLGLYANFRHAKIIPSLVDNCPLKPEVAQKGMDIVLVQELTGGMYFGEKGITQTEDGDEAAYDVEFYSESEIERVAVYAFEAAKRRRRVLTSLDKANVLETSRLWRRVVERVGREYPEVALNHMYADVAAMQLIKDPSRFDVILASNVFGDLLSNELSMLSGSIGLMPSVSMGSGRLGLYEPLHGPASGLVGQNKANPIAAILALALMFDYSLGQTGICHAIMRGVEQTLKTMRTPDIYQQGFTLCTTEEMGDAVLQSVMQQDF